MMVVRGIFNVFVISAGACPNAWAPIIITYVFDIDSIRYYEAYYQKLKSTECVA